MNTLRTLGNLLWHIPFLGFLNAIYTFLLGIVFCITIIGIPIGLGLFQLANFYLAPFSFRLLPDNKLKNRNKSEFLKFLEVILFIVYLPLGILNFLLVLVRIPLLFTTIIGIPPAIVLAKTLSTQFNPIGKVCVPIVVADEIQKKADQQKIDKYRNS